ncbi:MAG: dUTP diphosphatase [Nevskia sp.]|nr:dUTP diphosphatase [Nevskia sp.]
MRREVLEMLRLQADVNSKIDPAWLQARYPYMRAVLVETTEAMDHHGWKWWSKQTMNLEQLRIELIDIWHFALSQLLLDHGGDLAKAADEVEASWGNSDVADTLFDQPAPKNLLECLERMAGLAAFRQFSVPLFRRIMDDCGLSFEDLFRSYVAKNVLNHFRQDHGYKAGVYRKVWGGREDNEHLAEVVAGLREQPERLAAALYVELDRRYTATA